LGKTRTLGRRDAPRPSAPADAGAVDQPLTGERERERLLEIVLLGCGSAVTWQRARIVLLAAQEIPTPRIAELVADDPDTVLEVIDDFRRDRLDSLQPR
jgi:hypothetical protein